MHSIAPPPNSQLCIRPTRYAPVNSATALNMIVTPLAKSSSRTTGKLRLQRKTRCGTYSIFCHARKSASGVPKKTQGATRRLRKAQKEVPERGLAAAVPTDDPHIISPRKRQRNILQDGRSNHRVHKVRNLFQKLGSLQGFLYTDVYVLTPRVCRPGSLLKM